MLTETAFYYEDAKVLAQAAQLLGNAADAGKYNGLADEIRNAFNKRFFDPAKKLYATGSQCANAIPLVMGLVEPANRQAVLDAIVQDVRAHGNAVTAGDIGYRYLLRALAEGGRSDVICDMNNQSEKPGYGYQLNMGATSLTEAWNASRSSSQDHLMLGQIVEWFYHDLAGIQCDPASPGFRHVLIHPQPAGDVTWAKASYDSVRGKISVDWKRGAAGFELLVSIPAGSTATVFVPGHDAKAGTAQGVKLIRAEPGVAVFEVAAGEYQFGSTP